MKDRLTPFINEDLISFYQSKKKATLLEVFKRNKDILPNEKVEEIIARELIHTKQDYIEKRRSGNANNETCKKSNFSIYFDLLNFNESPELINLLSELNIPIRRSLKENLAIANVERGSYEHMGRAIQFFCSNKETYKLHPFIIPSKLVREIKSKKGHLWRNNKIDWTG